MNTKYTIIAGIIILIFGLTIGFFAGRGQQVYKETHTIEYKESDPIKINIPCPYPVKEITTTIRETQLPGKTEYKHDTISIVDTLAIVKDYLLQRTYSHTFFNSKEKGKLVVNSIVQYNKQQDLAIDYTPVQEIVTNTRVIKPIFTPFVSAGFNSFNQASAGGGMYYHNVGIEANYIYDLATKTTGYGGKLVIKF